MRKIISENFFCQNTLTVAEKLIGKFLVRELDGKEIALMLNEVEAYDGHLDKASHASKGKTPRNEVMFGQGGYFYVYLVYGMHWMLNIVTGNADYPAAILIRGAGDISGPARLTKFLGIDKSFNKKKSERSTKLWIEDRGVKINKNDIIRTARIGVHYAGPKWANEPYRFLLKQSK